MLAEQRPPAKNLDVDPAKAIGVVGTEHKTSPSRKDWISWELSWWFNTLFLSVEVGFVVAIFVLDQLSSRNNGIATVPKTTAQPSLFSIASSADYLGLLWTSLPSFLFSIFGLAWAGIVAASYKRQPFVELWNGGTAQDTILLDYTAYPQLYSWAVALYRGHRLLGSAMILVLVVSLAVAPLSAHLFVASVSTFNSTVPVIFSTKFNENLDISATNLQEFLEVATAIRARGSTTPAWMTAEYAFSRFTLASSYPSPSGAVNLTATTDAYEALLDCQIIDPELYNITYTSKGYGQNNTVLGDVSISFTDRFCDGLWTGPTSSATPIYIESWQVACSEQSVNRIGLVAGTYSASSPSSLDGISVISCIPSYWKITGPLTVSLNTAVPLTSNYIDFTKEMSSVMLPGWAETFEYALHTYSTFDSSSSTNSDAFGSATLTTALVAAGKNMTAAMETPSLRDAFERVFTTVYALLTASLGLISAPAVDVTSSTADLSEFANRLLVARQIAYVIVACLIAVLACHVGLWIYAARHHSVLNEEPRALLGHAVLLQGSDVSKAMDTVRSCAGTKKTVRDGIKNYKVDGKDAEWFWDKDQALIKVRRLPVSLVPPEPHE